ncbi:MAG: hypothetical protein EZS28_012270 [Streblomastix strix]|uniref:Uncharacterized protein n=1 Tax=Streblomastix strix TaxID=222440 RepID=A0A5J4WC19_9EUKA|nr:MAG: hypothetical protein EZS28_012270 [Streblomastix strix]
MIIYAFKLVTPDVYNQQTKAWCESAIKFSISSSSLQDYLIYPGRKDITPVYGCEDRAITHPFCLCTQHTAGNLLFVRNAAILGSCRSLIELGTIRQGGQVTQSEKLLPWFVMRQCLCIVYCCVCQYGCANTEDVSMPILEYSIRRVSIRLYLVIYLRFYLQLIGDVL